MAMPAALRRERKRLAPILSPQPINALRSSLISQVQAPHGARSFSTQVVRNRMKSVKNIQKINVRAVQTRAENSRGLWQPFTALLGGNPNVDVKKSVVVTISSDKGLCGGINSTSVKITSNHFFLAPPQFQAKMFHRTTRLLNLTRAFSTEVRTQKIERIADELLSLNPIERHDFTILWRLKLGLHRYGAPLAGISVSPLPSAASGSAAAVEKIAFDLKLEKYEAAAKIKIIKEVRAFTDLGLKEAKDLVEKVPCVLKKGLTVEEAEPIINKLKELGSAVVLE